MLFWYSKTFYLSLSKLKRKTMKSKLVILFDEDSEVVGMETSYVFSNERDAENFLLSYEDFISVKLEPDYNFFSFKLNAWSGTGKCFWATDKS